MSHGGVLLLDDDRDLLESLAALAEAVTRRPCVTCGSLAELRAAPERALACDVAILDINLGDGEPNGVDAFLWLRRARFAGAIHFLTGHADTHPLVRRARALGVARILRKPLEIDDLLAVLRDREEASAHRP